MVKRVKKEYEVIEGGVCNEPPEPVRVKNSIIVLPDRYERDRIGLPTAQERYDLIKKIRESGITLGTKVVRSDNISETNNSNPRMVGEVEQFLFTFYKGWGQYMPILVKFTYDGIESTFPFHLHEIETLERAKEIVEKQKAKQKQESLMPLEQRVLQDIDRERNGVIPFRRNPSTFYH